MKQRLVIITEIIAPYRIPVFNALAQHPEIDVSVIFLAKTDPSTRQWRIYAEEIKFSYEVLPSWRSRLKKYNLLLNQKVAAALRKANPNVIVCGGYNYLASWQALRWAKRNYTPFLLWCESTANDNRAGHRVVESLKKKFFNKCDGCIVPGTAAGEYAHRMGVSPEHIFVAPNAVDNDLFASHANRARQNAARVRADLNLPAQYFLFAGRLAKSKGIFELCEAYGSLDQKVRSQFGLVFAGEGPLRAELESIAKSISPGTITFAGFVQRDQLASYYGLAACLVFPTHSDPWGLVVNEAMACGLPVICGQSAGCAAELVKANGRLIDSRNVDQLAHAMQEIANDSDLCRQMSHESLKIIRNYSPEICASGIAQATLAYHCTRHGHPVGLNSNSRSASHSAGAFD
ncbi:MAG: glycosyltransferase family 4 protein [Terriglobales bacterium]